MGGRLPAAALGLWISLLIAAGGCRNPGAIGSLAPEEPPAAGAPAVEPGCDPACGDGERCDEAGSVCVACGDDDDEDDCAPALDAGECAGATCPECEDDEQCDADAPVCDDGRCVACEENSDCDGSGELECEDGRCVEAEEDDEEEASPADDDNGSGDEDLPDDL